jgi:two-component system sensor histidine kinase SenX3
VTEALAVLTVGLAVALGLLLINQRHTARRLRAAGERLAPDVVATGAGLNEATSLVERSIDRALLRDDRGSVASSRLADALSVLPQGIVLYDESGAIAFRNEVAAEAAGGEPFAARTVKLSGPPRRALALRATRLSKGGRRTGVLVVVEDVTERRRLEAVRRDFVANISHELRTPVGALALPAEAIIAEEEPVVVQRLGERMLAEAFRLNRLIEDLLELSSIESGDPDRLPVAEEVAVAELIGEAVERVRPAASLRGVTIDVGEVPEALEVMGDHRQLVSAIHNLLDNAVKYSDEGSAVEVRAGTVGGCVEMAVEDHGIGIPSRELERIFERFYRVDRARSRDTGGTGLGLAIVRHVAQNHDGEVRVDSTEGEGSTFTLRVPAGS